MPGQPDAVYFAPQDYARPARRVGAFLVDLLVVVLALMAMTQLVALLVVPRDVWAMPKSPEQQRQISKHLKPVQVPWGLAMLALPLLYHTTLRRLRGGTPGYRLMGVRLIDQRGETPSWRVVGRRFLLGVLGIIPLAATYLRCVKDPRRQTFHDQWAGTWVVKKRAQPAGPATTAYQTKLFGTLALTYTDLEPYTLAQAGTEKNEPMVEAACGLSAARNA